MYWWNQFIQKPKYAKSSIHSSLFHLQVTYQPLCKVSLWWASILCGIIIWKSLHNGRVGTWNEITTLKVNVVQWPLNYYTILFQPIAPSGHHFQLPWIFILHCYQVFCLKELKQALRNNYNISLPNATFKKPLLWKLKVILVMN
jgi:hypothetical protein